MQVRDLMSRDVVFISPEEPVSVAARLLSRNNVGALPVCSRDGRLRGMLTDRDIVLRCVAAQQDPLSTTVRSIMTSRVVSADPEEDAGEAIRRMGAEQVRRLPVTEGGRVVGMLSLGDAALHRGSAAEAVESLRAISRNVQKK